MALTTTTQILARLSQELRDEASTTDTSTRLLSRLNEAYIDIVSGGKNLNDGHTGRHTGKPYIWSWALSPNSLRFVTEIPILDRTATTTLGSSTVTLSSTVADSLAGWHIKINEDLEVYKILAHTAGTNEITLDTTYVNASASSVAADIFKIDYTIGTDLLLPTNGLVCFYQNDPLPLMDKREFEKYNVLKNISQGNPKAAAVLYRDADSKSVTIRLDAYTAVPERFELPYVPYPTVLDLAGANPILPPNDNQILIDYAAALEYDLRDDTIADKYFKRALDRFSGMKAEDRQFTAYQDPNYAKVIAWSSNPQTLKGSRVGGHPRNGRGWQGN